MKNFIDYMNEDVQEPSQKRISGFMASLVPAIKHPSGKVYVGWRGKAHIDIRHKYADADGPLKGDAGYVDRRSGKFHHKYGSEGLGIDSTRLKPDVDSTDLMTPLQRMRKYGTFEEGCVIDENGVVIT